MEANILTTDVIIIFTILSFFTAVISGIMGMIGGMILVVVGTFFVPFDVFLPIHATVQLISNSSRIMMAFSDLDKPVFAKFSMGSVFGTFLGTWVVVMLPRPLLLSISYTFILMSTWIKMLSFNFRFGFSILGAFQGFLGGLIGATGPVGMPTLIHRYGDKSDYNRIIITNSGFSMISHFFRVIAFGVWGYAYSAIWHVVAFMAITTVLGSYAGTKIRNKVSGKKQMVLFIKILLTVVVAIGLIRTIYNNFIIG